MSRYDAMFEHARDAGEGVFGGFLMLGDPDRARGDALLDALVEGGCDMVELGIPFSDPIADGPIIQAAATRALAAGIRTGDCLEILADFRARHPDIPIGVLTYANLVLARGRETFARELAEAGTDSLLVADVPVAEAAPWLLAAREAGIAPVLIAASNTPDERLRAIARDGAGYTYCLARAGVTGERDDIDLDHGPMLATLKEAGAPPPIFGFGISQPVHVRAALDAGAAGVISGSAIVRLAAQSASPTAAVRAFASRMKASTTDRIKLGCVAR